MRRALWMGMWWPAATARLVNVTIDDWYGDARTGRVPLYASEHRWNAARDTCDCAVQVDASHMYNRTWHDETTFPGQIPSNVSFSFEGTALWIFCTMVNSNSNLQFRDTRLAFYLDDSPSPAAQFHHRPDETDDFSYDHVVYSNEAIPAGKHTMLLSNWATEDSGSLVLFDYAIYTVDIPDTSAESTPAPRTDAPTSGPVSGASGSAPHATDAATRTSSQAATTSSASGSAPPATETASTSSETASTSSDIGTDVSASGSAGSTTTLTTPQAAPRSSVTAIAGGAGASALLALLLVCGLAWWCIARRRRAQLEIAVHPVSAAPTRVRIDTDVRAAKLDAFSSPGQSSNPASTISRSLAITTENGNLRLEVEQIREELERLRQSVEPPRYDPAAT